MKARGREEKGREREKRGRERGKGEGRLTLMRSWTAGPLIG